MSSPTCGELYSLAPEPKPLTSYRGDLVTAVNGGYGSSVIIKPEGVEFLEQAQGHRVGLEELRDVTGIAFGDGHALATTRDGRLLAWGSGKWGQCGLGAKVQSTTRALVVKGALEGKNVIAVSCGGCHSAVLTDTGDVYTWGRGFEGQTGHASRALSSETNNVITAVQLLPKCVSAFVKQPVTSVSCGHNFTAVVVENGSVYAWGEGGSGQLGYGRVTKQAVPKVVLTKCPETEQPFISVECGWGHTLALTSAGEMYSWGLNSYGQLGLGDDKARYYPERVTSDEEESVKFSKITAGSNYSLAITPNSELYSFGCNESGQLGHGDTEHRFVPTFVHGLRGKRMSMIASSSRKTYAFAPTSIYSLDPPMGPLSGGSKVTVRGGGFWDAESIIVRFIPPPEAKKAVTRAAVGAYSEDEESGKQFVLCKTPRFVQPGDITVELSMNGKDFTENSTVYSYYLDPTVTKVNPTYCNAFDGVLIEIDGSHFFNSPLLQVRFKGRGGTSKGEIIVPAKYHEQIIGTEIDEETEEEVDVIRKYVVCRSPKLSDFTEDQLPWETRVAVALNGKDFKNLDKTKFYFHDFRPTISSPRAAPLSGGTTIVINGTSFFDAGEGNMLAKFTWPHTVEVDGEMVEEEQVVVLPVMYESRTELTCEIYALDGTGDVEILNQKNKSAPLYDEEADSVPCTIAISIDGGATYLDSMVDFVYYKETEWSPMRSDEITGPFSGGTQVDFVSSPTALEASDEAIVKFYTEDGSFESFAKANLEVGQEEELILRCAAPPYVVPEPEADAEGEGEDSEGKEAEEEKEGSEEKDANIEENEEGDDGDAEALVDEDGLPIESPAPALPKAEVIEVFMSVAYNGANFMPPSGRFLYYPDPVAEVSEPTSVSEGDTLTIKGTNFFDTPKIEVRFSPTDGQGEETVVPARMQKAGSVKCVVPKLAVDDSEIAQGGEDADAAEEKKGGEVEVDDVDAEDGAGVEVVPYIAAVTFNGTEYTDCVSLDYLPKRRQVVEEEE